MATLNLNGIARRSECGAYFCLILCTRSSQQLVVRVTLVYELHVDVIWCLWLVISYHRLRLDEQTIFRAFLTVFHQYALVYVCFVAKILFSINISTDAVIDVNSRTDCVCVCCAFLLRKCQQNRSSCGPSITRCSKCYRRVCVWAKASNFRCVPVSVPLGYLWLELSFRVKFRMR